MSNTVPEDNYWWAGPACRADTTKCLPIITAAWDDMFFFFSSIIVSFLFLWMVLRFGRQGV